MPTVGQPAVPAAAISDEAAKELEKEEKKKKKEEKKDKESKERIKAAYVRSIGQILATILGIVLTVVISMTLMKSGTSTSPKGILKEEIKDAEKGEKPPKDKTKVKVATPGAGIQFSGGSDKYEASGVVQVPNSDGVYFIDDSKPDKIFWMQLDDKGKQVGDIKAISIGAETADPGFDPHLAPDPTPLWNVIDWTPEGRAAGWYPKLEY